VKIALVAGEASGDLLGAGLVRAIRERVPDAHFEGVAGPEMLAAGCDRIADADTLAVMGLIEPLKVLPRLLSLRRALVKRWTTSPPDVFVGIDAPDFNLGLELALRRAGVSTAHYVSPSVWAWREGRIRKIRKAADCVLCILPFETEFYAQHGVRAEFVGHPKADKTPTFANAAEARRHLGVDVEGEIIAVLPGSRASEVDKLVTAFAGAAAILHRDKPALRFLTPVARPKLRSSIEEAIAELGMTAAFTLFDGESEAAMAAADIVLLASGTAALEAALLCKPTVAAYRMSGMTVGIVRALNLIKIDQFALPNLLTEKAYVPEFMQEEVTASGIARELAAMLDDPTRCAGIRKRFATLRTELALDADQRAADVVVDLASSH